MRMTKGQRLSKTKSKKMPKYCRFRRVWLILVTLNNTIASPCGEVIAKNIIYFKLCNFVYSVNNKLSGVRVDDNVLDVTIDKVLNSE